MAGGTITGFQFGDGLIVTDEGDGITRLDVCVECTNSGGATTYTDAVLAHPCLAHYWPCDETSGNLIDRKGSIDPSRIAATSGSGQPTYGAAGPFTSFPALTAVHNSGSFGVVAHDDGQFNGLMSGFSPTTYTLEAWVWFDSATFQSMIIQFGDASFSLFTPAWTLQFGCGNIGVSDVVTVPTGAWQYLVGTFDGTNARFYRNATLVGTGTPTSHASWSAQFSFTNNYLGPSYAPLNGRLAQVALYNCALSASEITNHFSLRGATGDHPSGMVLTSDGSGGTTWDYPTIQVYLNGV